MKSRPEKRIVVSNHWKSRAGIFPIIGILGALSAGAAVTRGPYLQEPTPHQMIVRWRTDVAGDSRVAFGTSSGSLTQSVVIASVTNEHEVLLTGLAADTRYFYSIGSTVSTDASGPGVLFYTAPPVGTRQPVRIWAIGDCGTGDSNQARVIAAYTNFTGAISTDLILALGDDAYNAGLDGEFTTNFFAPNAQLFKQSAVWSCVGNHETDQSTNPPTTIAYYESFTFPTAGECGGIASGTKNYFSFDYANIHFISLDATVSPRTTNGAMAMWLQNDIAASTQEWCIAFLHQPPYSKGGHDSDTESEMVEIRENIVPILEQGGVDLLIGAHDHDYERSWLINGHYGDSSTFDPATMLVNGGDGRETGNGAYHKPDGLNGHQGTVYVVTGSAGHLTAWQGGSNAITNPTPHPVMYSSLLVLGSLVVDVLSNRMDVKFLRDTGAIDDQFTIIKDIPNKAPTIKLTAPANGASFNAPASVFMSANASDSDGRVAKVEFFASGWLVGKATNAPFAATWTGGTPGSYWIDAMATDNRGASTLAGAVLINVINPLPSAPAGLTLGGITRSSMILNWTDTSSNESGFKIERAVNGGAFAQIATVAANMKTFTATGLRRNTTYSFRVRATNAAGDSPYSNTATAKTPSR